MTPNTRTLKGQSYCSQRWANPAWPKGSKSRGFSSMSVHQRSGVSVRPCGLAFSNVCFRPCSFICLVASSFLSAKEYTNLPVCIVSPLRGSIWLRSGSLWRSSAPSWLVFPPYLCTQAAGQRSRCAHRTPVPSFFWAAGRYRSPDTFGVGNRQVYPQSGVYGFLCP